MTRRPNDRWRGPRIEVPSLAAEMRAFDALSPTLRAALNTCRARASAFEILYYAQRGVPEATLLKILREAREDG